VTGKIDLANERVIPVAPASKGVRVLSLHSPIDVKGPFRNIDVGVERALARVGGRRYRPGASPRRPPRWCR
jgi:hypothetical protein